MSKIPRMVAVLGATLAALLFASAALAQGPQPPHNCFGWSDSVMIDGAAAPAGAQIVAMVDGERVGSDSLGADGWSIEVAGQPSMVTFTVNGMAAEGTCDASEGGGQTAISLSAMSAADDSDDSGDLESDGSDDGSMMDDGSDDGSMMDDGSDDGSMMDDGSDDGSMMDDGDDDDSMMGEGDDDSMMGEGDDSMMDEDAPGDGGMMDDGDSQFPDTGTGGLAQGGSSSALYGGIAATLALVALLGGVAVRRRVRS